MNYRDEEDIFEEDIVFDQAGLLSAARKRGKSAIRRVSSGRCAMLSKTLALCGAFFGLGLSIALPGPATPMPPTELDNQSGNGGEEHIYRCLGFMLGSLLGGMLLDRFNRLFLVFLALLMCAILVAMVPWTGILWLLRSDLILLGATMGFLLTGGNVLCLDLWGQNSGPFMQALHFSFSLGAFLAPLIATPLNPVLPTMPPITEHHRLPRSLDNATLGFAEGMSVTPMQILNFTASSPIPPSSLAPTNTTNHPLLSSQATVENGTSITVNKTSTLAALNMSLVSSTTASVPHSSSRTHKPKPEVNSGKNLDKPAIWEKIHAGKPPPKDVIPIPSTKATTLVLSSSSSVLTSSTPSTTVDVSKLPVAMTGNTSSTTTTTPASLPIQDIFQKETIPSKVSGSDVQEKEDKTSVTNTVVKGDKVNVVSSTASTKLPQSRLETSTTSTSTTIAPEVVSSPSSKPAQLDVKTSTAATLASSTKLPDKATSRSDPPTTSSTTTSSINYLSDPPPKSLTLTEKKPPTEVSTATPRSTSSTATPSPTPSLAVTPSTSKLPSSEKHVDATSAPHRHHSKPTSYDNDTEEIHTVMDEVADHFGKEYGLSRLQLSYLLVALLLFVVSLLFLGFLCFNPRDPRSRSEEDVGGGRSNVIRPRWIRILLTTLMMLVLALSAGVQFSYGQLLVLFAMRSPLALSLSTGTALTATFWGASTSTRLACILLASALSPGALLVISIALTAAATWLLSALAVQSAAALWVGAVLIAVGTASILPSSFLWMQQHVHVSHHVAGMLVMGPAMGEMLFPPLAMRIITAVGPSGLLHLPALLSLAVIALWAAAWRLARHPCSSLCAHADPGSHSYQLASQTDEDDLLDLTMSPVTHRGNATIARRSSSHANGNGLHRLNT